MLIYLKGKGSDAVQTRAVSIEKITCVQQVQPANEDKSKFVFSIVLRNWEIVFSKCYDTREEAEMNQLSTISLINAIDIFFYRIKNNLDLGNIYFHWVDVENRKLVLSQLPTDIQIFTIEI